MIYSNHQIQQSYFDGQKIKPNRPMECPIVENALRISWRGVRFAAKGSLNEVNKLKNNGFGRQVISHASRPEGLANYCYYYYYLFRLQRNSNNNSPIKGPNTKYTKYIKYINIKKYKTNKNITVFFFKNCPAEIIN